MVRALGAAISSKEPHLILFGGDYLDGKGGMNHLRDLFQCLHAVAPCYGILGNHDRWFFGRRLVKETAALVTWLEGNSIAIPGVGIDVRIDISVADHDPADESLRILLLHEPAPFTPSLKGYDIILAGHLHGCQFVTHEKAGYLYPGAWFYPQNFLDRVQGKTHYFISKGLGDTLPMRLNCPKDILLVDVLP